LILHAFIAKFLNENADFRGIARLDGPDEEMGVYCIF
jgi:hypothetical protein